MSRVPLRPGLLRLPDESGSGALLASRCGACERHSFPAQPSCPYCGAEQSQTVDLSPQGILEVCTTVVNRPPGYEGPMPFGFGVVELPEGLRIISRIQNPEQVRPGTAVTLVFETLGTDAQDREIVTYAFSPNATNVDRPPANR